MHVWACLFVCARRKWECACGSVNVKCGATVCILQSVFVTRRTKRAAHPSLLKSQTEHVSLTTAGHGQFLAGYDRAVVSPDINGGSLTVMSGCDGSIFGHRREAGWAIRDMSHIGHAGWFTIKIYHILWGRNSHYSMVTYTRQPLKSVGFIVYYSLWDGLLVKLYG